MAGAIERFEDAAARAGISVQVRRFPEGTRTAADAARAVGCAVGQIVKSLVLAADDGFVLALTSGPNRADPALLAGLAGAKRVRMAGAEEARTATGFAVGGTPPFGHTTRLRTFVDRDLMGYGVVWAAAGTPDSVFPMAPEALLAACGGEVADLKVRPG